MPMRPRHSWVRPTRQCASPRGYLDGRSIIEAARTAGADAIHPGYGFLSENAAFARSVVDAGLTWVGPPPDVIDAMGDKLAAKRAAVTAGVPTLPSSDDPEADGKVGYPVAGQGGGGRRRQGHAHRRSRR